MAKPLAPGTVLADRFEIGRVIGRGGFSIVYDVIDRRRDDRAVVKELAPAGADRHGETLLDLGTAGPDLRRAFLNEAQTISRLTLPGVLPVRLAFVANGTAYVATDAVAGGRTLEVILKEEGPLDPTGTLDLAYQLMETLEAVHARGLLHRDIKPSNILVDPSGRAYLIDFGAARTYSADAQEAHTVLFTPGFAPPEQMSPVARRGPAIDVYGLCATMYAALAGRPPEDATARAAGTPLIPLLEFRTDLDPAVAEAIESGLALRAGERPANMLEFRRLLDSGPADRALDTLDSLDGLLVRLRRFVFDRRACPACNGVLEERRPIAADGCPVCRRGRIRTRKLTGRVCPLCRTGILHHHGRQADLLPCPSCAEGRLRWSRGGMLSRQRIGRCSRCGERFEESTVRKDEILANLAREAETWWCDGCPGQFDVRSDGRWRQVFPKSSGIRDRYPLEWARLAAGLEPEAGEAECDACGADYGIRDGVVSLLSAPEDPHGFAATYQGRPLRRETLRWLAVGKRSPFPGPVCEDCGTEFDRVGSELRLVDSPNRRLDRRSGESLPAESWHRIAEGLPEAGQVSELEERIVHALGSAFRRGEVGFGELAWRGPAEYRGRRTTLIARDDDLRIGKGFRTKTIQLIDLRDIRAEGDWLLADAPGEALELRIEPVELVGHLRSGDRAVLLTAQDLAARLTWKTLTTRAFRL